MDVNILDISDILEEDSHISPVPFNKIRQVVYIPIRPIWEKEDYNDINLKSSICPEPSI